MGVRRLLAAAAVGLSCTCPSAVNAQAPAPQYFQPADAAPIGPYVSPYPSTSAPPWVPGVPPRYEGIQTAGTIPHPAVVAAAQPPIPAVPLAPVPEGDLVERLRQAETRIKQLENFRDLDVREDKQTGQVLETLRERWDQARDPSITTVDQQTHDASKKKASEKKWFDRLSIRGYAQMRFNEVLEREPGSAPAQYVGDRSIGDDQSFLIRRARVIISGDVSDHMYVYLQPDFASTPSGSTDATYFAQIRDWYADLYLDECKINRLRVGQSKVPYGWENLQSSSNRLALDRADALNSAVRNERDLGVFYYWTPTWAQDFFKHVLDKGLKGSGNYGVFGMGLHNGQGGSFLEQNDNLHFVSRLAIPHQFAGGQCMEVGIQGYIGEYAVFGTPIRPLGVGGLSTPGGTLQSTPLVRNIRDERIAGTFVWYPQPIGFQAEWNVGRGPGLNDLQTLVEDRHLYGGYVQTMAKYDTRCHGTIFPFVRWSMYNGGYKPERNAVFSEIDECELGAEWQFNPQMELTTTYLITDRTNTTAFTAPGAVSYNQFDGSVLRFQFQFNY